jgi:hypothetical protein
MVGVWGEGRGLCEKYVKERSKERRRKDKLGEGKGRRERLKGMLKDGGRLMMMENGNKEMLDGRVKEGE